MGSVIRVDESGRWRWALVVEYHGGGFSGWQRLAHARTVQPLLEQALGEIAGHPLRVSCAGRTDAGVHATAQVLHFDTTAERLPLDWIRGGNRHLPAEVAIWDAAAVPPAFEARHQACWRQYRYLLLNRRGRPGLMNGRVAHVPVPLDEQLMAEAAAQLLGTHDFSSFRSSECAARHPWRRLEQLEVRRDGDWLWFDVRANAFLHHMVRNLVGSLLAVGRGQRSVTWLAEVLQARDRRLAAATAAADGLYLVGAGYPPESGYQSVLAWPVGLPGAALPAAAPCGPRVTVPTE